MKEANKEQMAMVSQDEGFETRMKEMEAKIKREQEAKEKELQDA